MKFLPALLFLFAFLSASATGFFLTVGGINGVASDGHKIEGQFGSIFRSEDGES